MSVLRAVRKRKKVRKLGAIDIIRREAYADLELDAKVELIRALVPLGLLHVQELLAPGSDGAGRAARYARKDESVEGRRHGKQPWDGGSGGATCADSCAPPSPHRGERDPVAVLRGDAWRS